MVIPLLLEGGVVWYTIQLGAVLCGGGLDMSYVQTYANFRVNICVSCMSCSGCEYCNYAMYSESSLLDKGGEMVLLSGDIGGVYIVRRDLGVGSLKRGRG